MFKVIILTFFFGWSLTGSTSDTTLVMEGWEFIKEEKGLKLYNRTLKGYTDKEVMVILNLDVDIEKAKNYLYNPDNIEKWMSGCSMSVTKKDTKESGKEYYAIFDAPWPISDRDDYGKIELVASSDSLLQINFNSIPAATPEISNMVRIPYSKGKVKIELDASGNKILTYQFHVDRGGKLPNYLKDYLENSSPVSTVAKLKLALESL